MISTNVFEFRKNLASLINEVERKGNKIVITKFGKPVAVLTEYNAEVGDIEKYLGMLPGKETGVEFENRVRRSKKEKMWLKRYAR